LMSFRAIIPLAALLIALADGRSVSAAAPAVRFSVAPHTAKAAGKVTVRASNLHARSSYILLFVPDKKTKLERLLATETADGHGSFSARLTLPYVSYCGSATVYLMSPHKILAHAKLRVTGCNSKVSAPPPPPKH